MTTIVGKYTPGPWEYFQGAYSLRPDEFSIFPVGAGGDGQKRVACWIRTKADAELLTASLPMLEALQRILVEAKNIGCQCTLGACSVCEIVFIAEEAIAKATGVAANSEPHHAAP